MKNLSRRDFLKGSVAGAAGLALASLGFHDSARAAGLYTPGTYSATATGMGTVLVTMTFSEDAITDVVLDVSGETASIGQAAAEELREALMNSQSAEIDGVAGASITSGAVREAAAKCIAQAKGEIPVEVIGTAEGRDPGDRFPGGRRGQRRPLRRCLCYQQGLQDPRHREGHHPRPRPRLVRRLRLRGYAGLRRGPDGSRRHAP